MKHYLYHRVPKNLTGNILYPLNQLKDKYPILYDEHVSKYEGRESLKKREIPVLNCLWNDVLHFGAVHPQEIFDELKKYDKKEYTAKYYKIPPELLEKENTIVYLYKYKELEEKVNPQDFVEYDFNKIDLYSNLPQGTKDYYKESYNDGGSPLLWHKVPHILYKGTVEVDGLEVIEVG